MSTVDDKSNCDILKGNGYNLGMTRKPYTLDTTQEGNQLTLRLPEKFDTFLTGRCWTSTTTLQQTLQPAHLIIDASHNTYCDSAGMTLLQILAQTQQSHGGTFALHGANEHFQKTFDHLSSLSAPISTPTPSYSFIYRFGHFTYDIAHELAENVAFIGETVYEITRHLTSPQKLRWGDFWVFLERVGPNALPIAALLGFILGLILSFQALMSLERFGASIYVINLVNISLTRELGPLMTAIILAGRTASAYAAELGTMKINREIDALTTMGLNPISFLVVPRLLSAFVMTPLLNIYIIIFGYIGCLIVVLPNVHSFSIFFNQLYLSFCLSDFLGGTFKCFVFGILISSIGCLRGLKTKSHAAAVGETTTKAVVSSIIMLGLADGLLSMLYYIVGI